MNAIAPNIVQLEIKPRASKSRNRRHRFNIQEFTNRGGSTSWRVTGIKKNGERVRENFSEQAAADVRKIELETEYAQGHTETTVKETTLAREQIRLSESAIQQLGEDWPRLLDAVVYWQQNGKKRAVIESPRLDDAFTQYCAWLPQSGLRTLSQNNQRRRVNVFANSVRNLPVSDFTHELIEEFLSKRQVTAISKDNDRRAISGFFSWCIEPPRRWIAHNPCKEIRIARNEKQPPAVLTVDQCKKLLKAAEKFKGGKHATFTAVSLFAGLRPFEVARLTWESVNLADREIRLEGITTKTGRARVVTICDTLATWLKAYEGKPFYVPGWLKDFRVIKEAIGYGVKSDKKPHLKPWVNDILRHTAASHYFRKTGSYGQTAEQFGNSEQIIKAHYQGRVSSEDTKKFYALKPAKKK